MLFIPTLHGFMSGQGGEGTFEELYAHFEKAFRELDIRKTLNFLNKMLEISEDDLQECWTRVGFATLSLMSEGDELDLTEARELANYALALSKKKENQKMELDAKGLISLIEYKCGNWPAYIENTEEMILLSEELNEVDWICGSHLYLCKGYSMMKLFTKAKLHLDLGYSYVQSDPILSNSCDLTNIQYLLALGNSASAEQLISTKIEILKIANNIASNDQVPYAMLHDSLGIIRNLEKDMGTSLFSSDLQQLNVDEGQELTQQSNEDEDWYTYLGETGNFQEEITNASTADAILRMDDVRARNPHLWDEAAKQKRRKEWKPYRVDESEHSFRRNNTIAAIKTNKHNQVKQPKKIMQPKKKDGGLGMWLWLAAGAAFFFMTGGMLSG